VGCNRRFIFLRRRLCVAREKEGLMISVGRVLTFSAIGFLLPMMLVIGTGCAGRKYYLAELGDMDRGVDVRNDSAQLMAVRVFSISASVVEDPGTKFIQPAGHFPFRLFDVGGRTVSVYARSVNVHGEPVADEKGRPVSWVRCDVSFPWGHEVGNAADYNRNHKSVTWDGRNLWSR
jgi:hypothetical protein